MGRKVFIFFVLVVGLSSLGSLQAMTKTGRQEGEQGQKQPISSRFEEKSPVTKTMRAVGVRTFCYEDEKRKRPVTVELWYPTQESQPLDKPLDLYWVHPAEVRDASFAEGVLKCPLIILSHGHQGNRRDRSWFADYLVQNGFIVASVDHHGNTWHTFNAATSLKFWERAKDIRFALDHLLEEPFLKEKVDRERIGFSGYSLGGMTGLAVGGGKVKDLQQALELHKDKYQELTQGMPKELLSQIDLTESMGDFADPRIKALLLICPANFAYMEEGLKEIKVPVGLIGLVQDEILPYQKHIDPLILHLNPKRLKVWHERISHYAFLNPVSEIGKKIFPSAFYTLPPDPQKALLHKEVGEFAVEFFREQLSIKEDLQALQMCVND